MSANICSYEGCMVRRLPCSSIAFFAIPTDNRRQQWIINSGNKDLRNLSVNRARYFCESHFHASDIKQHLHRKTLRRGAVPIPYDPSRTVNARRPTTELKKMVKQFRNGRACILRAKEGSQESTRSEMDLAVNEYLEKGLSDVIDEVEDDGIELCNERTDQYTEEMENILIEELQEDSFNEDVHLQEFAIESVSKSCQQLPANTGKKSKDETGHDLSTYDDDKHFALSLVGYFQRLSHEKKVIAKLKILSYLTALELNKSADL